MAINSARKYVDTNVILTALRSEGAENLLPQLAEQAAIEGVPLVTSSLTNVEIRRALLREGTPITIEVARVFEGFDVVTLSGDIVELAARLPVQYLKTLDAIHLATSIASGCNTVITRDKQFARACGEVGMSVA